MLEESNIKWVQRGSYTDSFSEKLGRGSIKHLPEKTFPSVFDYTRYYMWIMLLENTEPLVLLLALIIGQLILYYLALNLDLN